MRAVFIFSAICFYLLFKPLDALRIYTPIDDRCYAQFAGRLVGEQVQGCVGGSFAPGVALAWLPASVPAKILGKLRGDAFETTLPFFVGPLAFFYWVAGFSLIFLLGESSGESKRFEWAFLGLSAPVLYYATSRTTLVHAPEFFFSLLTFYFARRGRALPCFAAAMMTTMLRYNDVGILIVPVLAAWKGHPRLRWVFWSVSVLVGVALTYLIGVKGYHGMNLHRMVGKLNPERFYQVFLGGDWGLLWTAPLWLAIFGLGLQNWRSLSNLAKGALGMMLISLMSCLAWRGNGSDFGYRYLIGSYAAAFFVFFELRPLVGLLRERRLLKLAKLNAVWMTWLVWIYKEFPETTPVPSKEALWTLPHLLVNSLKMLFDWRGYLLPPDHSALGVWGITVFNPMSAGALQGGWTYPPFWILTVLVFGIPLGFGVDWAVRSRHRLSSRKE